MHGINIIYNHCSFGYTPIFLNMFNLSPSIASLLTCFGIP